MVTAFEENSFLGTGALIAGWNQPYYWKGGPLQYPTTLLGDIGILMLLVS